MKKILFILITILLFAFPSSVLANNIYVRPDGEAVA
jgi:hypothetical protein